MRITLLSAGPSLGLYTPPGPPAPGSVSPGDGLVIAVNRAAAIHRCDWWAAGDFKALQIVKPLRAHDGAMPKLLTMRCKHKADAYQALGFDTVRTVDEFECPVPRWRLFTATSALVFAVHLGAKQIDCYGVDMAGSAYFNGATNGRVNEKRWAKERPIWDEIVIWALRQGVEVSRYLANGDEVHSVAMPEGAAA